MALTTQLLADQDAGFDQCRDNLNQVFGDSVESKQLLADLVGNGMFNAQPWYARVMAQLDKVKGGVFTRTESERDLTREAKELQTGESEVDHWLTDNVLTLKRATKQDIPEAGIYFSRVSGGEGGGFRNTDKELDFVLRSFQEAGDLSRFGFKDGHLERGYALQAKLRGDRAQQVGEQVGISAGAMAVHAALAELAALMEDLNDARELASHRLRRELPGFDLRLIRAVVARGPVPEPEPAPAEPANKGL